MFFILNVSTSFDVQKDNEIQKFVNKEKFFMKCMILTIFLPVIRIQLKYMYTIEVVSKIPVSSPRANLFPEAKPMKIDLLEGNWNLPNTHNGIL